MIRNNKTSKTIERPAPQIGQLQFAYGIVISIKNAPYHIIFVTFCKRIQILDNNRHMATLITDSSVITHSL